MTSSDFALLISGISLPIAMLALSWNVYEKFIFVKPRLQVSFGVVSVIQNGKVGKKLLSLSVTNLGPGPAIIHSTIARIRKSRF